MLLDRSFLTTGDTSYISRTIIDGNNKGSVIRISKRDSSLISGFSITNGCGTKDYYATMGTILDSIYYGGGFYITDSCGTKLEDLKIYSNKADRGGGLYVSLSSPIISKILVTSNIASDMGGGLFFDPYSLTITSSVFSKNSALSGGGIICGAGFGNNALNLINTEISNNFCKQVGIISLGSGLSGGGSLNMTNVTVVNNDISMANHILNIQNSIMYNSGVSLNSQHVKNSTTVSYSNIQNGENAFYLNNSGMIWGEGNISADPKFVNYEKADYRLQFGSPCINAGNPDIVYNNSDGSRNDIGAYAYIPASFIDNPEKSGDYFIYPNPCKDMLLVNPVLKKDIRTFSIFNLMGSLLIKGSEIKSSIDVSSLSAGLYIIRLDTDKNTIEMKFMKE